MATKSKTPRKKVRRPPGDQLRRMAAQKMSTTDLSARFGITPQLTRKWMREAGCQSDANGWWHLPAVEPDQAAPPRTGKSVLAEQFPFIKTAPMETITGKTITMPSIGIWEAAREKMKSVSAHVSAIADQKNRKELINA